LNHKPYTHQGFRFQNIITLNAFAIQFELNYILQFIILSFSSNFDNAKIKLHIVMMCMTEIFCYYFCFYGYSYIVKSQLVIRNRILLKPEFINVIMGGKVGL